MSDNDFDLLDKKNVDVDVDVDLSDLYVDTSDLSEHFVYLYDISRTRTHFKDVFIK